MFRNTIGINRLLYRRLLSNRMSSTSTAETSCPVTTPDGGSNEKSLIPEYLRYRENESSWKKFKRFIAGDSGPMLPCVLALIGVHVYVGWYLFGGEFESDFEDEKVELISNFVANTKKKYTTVTSRFGSKVEDSTERDPSETENFVSS